MSKTLYHSQLVRLGQIEVRVKSDVMKSNYAGKPPYVILDINGNERLYTTENADCADALRGLKGRMVQLEARGSRDDAQIVIETLDGAHETSKQHDAVGFTRVPAAAPETFAEQQAREAKTFVEATRFAAKMRVLLTIAYNQAESFYKHGDYADLSTYELEDLRLRLANTLAIETKQNIPVASLPAQWPEQREEFTVGSGGAAGTAKRPSIEHGEEKNQEQTFRKNAPDLDDDDIPL